MAAPFVPDPEPGRGGGALVSWAERTARPDRRPAGHGMVRFVFYGRVSTEDWQDPVTSRARQREQAEALVRGHGVIVAELFDVGVPGRSRGRGARSPLRWSLSWRIQIGGGTQW